MEITINAPAKLNLYLDILGKRDDGYHDVEMIMQSVNLCDTISITTENHRKINVTSNVQVSENISDNTAYRAAEAFFLYTNITNPGIDIRIKKRIPIYAGLAGGSTDAASVLIALNSLFSTNFSKNELATIGKTIGADVPFCIYGGTMLASGIGTTLKPLPALPECYIVIVKPDISVSTKVAYEASDASAHHTNYSTKTMTSALQSNNISQLASCLYNRFEEVLQLKEVHKIKNLLIKHGALNACMSGTGSAVFGIFTDEKIATTCKANIEKIYKNVFFTVPFNHSPNASTC